MSRCIVKQSLSQPVAVSPVAPVAQVSPVSVSPVSVTPVSVSVAVTAAQPVSDASGLFMHLQASALILVLSLCVTWGSSHRLLVVRLFKTRSVMSTESWHYSFCVISVTKHKCFGDNMRTYD